MPLNSKLTKTAAIKEWIDERIEQQVYRAGQKIPSVRALAKQLGVSTFTVVQAYETLIATGKIEAKRGAGYFVSHAHSPTALPSLPLYHYEKAVDSTWLMQHLYANTHLQHTPGSGVLPKDWLYFERTANVVKQTAANVHQFIYKQSNIQGYLPLREQYAYHLQSLGIRVGANELITSAGVSSAVALISRYLLKPGDAVLVDEPSWFWLIANLQSYGLRIYAVNRDSEGPDIEQLRNILSKETPKLYVTNSVLHNPTSYNIHPSRAYQVLNLMYEFSCYILEDDIYGYFDEDAPALRYAALDRERVFYTTGVSKILGSNWRQAIFCGPREHRDELLQFKTLLQLNDSELLERGVYGLLTEPGLRKHIQALKQKLLQAHLHLQTALPHYQLNYPDDTRNGFFLWLDSHCDSTELALAARHAGFLIAPGQLFSATQRPSTFIRINVARTDTHFLKWLKAYRDKQSKL